MYLVNNVHIFFYFTFYKMIYTMIVNELLIKWRIRKDK